MKHSRTLKRLCCGALAAGMVALSACGGGGSNANAGAGDTSAAGGSSGHGQRMKKIEKGKRSGKIELEV